MATTIIRPIATQRNNNWTVTGASSAYQAVDDIVSYPDVPSSTDKITASLGTLSDAILELDDVYSTISAFGISIYVYVNMENNNGTPINLAGLFIGQDMVAYGSGSLLYSNSIETFTGWKVVTFNTPLSYTSINNAYLRLLSTVETGSGNILEIYCAYIEISHLASIGGPDPVSPPAIGPFSNEDDLKFYLTVKEPLISQGNYSQSTGGFPSTTETNLNSLLYDVLTVSGDSFETTSSLETPYSVLINDELMRVSGSGTEFTVLEHGFAGTDLKIQRSGSVVRAINKNSFFNNSLVDNKQYRCVAIKNEGLYPYYDLRFYLKKSSDNANCDIKFAIEVPQKELISSVATGGSTISVVDSTLIGLYDDNWFLGQVLKFTSGDNINLTRIVASFDKETGTFTFTNSLTSEIISGISYIVEPSATIYNGTPVFDTDYISELSSAKTLEDAVGININNTRGNGSNLHPNEIVYIWFERTLANNTEKYDNNSIVLACSYNKTL